MKRVRSFVGLLGILALFVLFPSSAQAEPVGKFTHIEGRVDITSPGQAARPASLGEEVSVEDIVRSKSKAKAEITFIDGNVLRFARNTRVKINEYEVGKEGSKGILKLFRGKIQSIVNRALGGTFGRNKKYIFEVHTPTAVCGVRGTNFFTWYEWGASYVAFKEGKGYVLPMNREDLMILVNKGEGARALGPDQPLLKFPVSHESMEELEQDTVPSDKTTEDEDKEEGRNRPGQQRKTKIAKRSSKGEPGGDALFGDPLELAHEALKDLGGNDGFIGSKDLTDYSHLTTRLAALHETTLTWEESLSRLSAHDQITNPPGGVEPEEWPILYQGAVWPHGSFDGLGSITVAASEGHQVSYRGQDSGTWAFEASGSYDRCKISDVWALHLKNATTDPEIHRWAEVVGSKWSQANTAGKVAGAWVNLEHAMTGVAGGELLGNYNPTNLTWQAVAEGSLMETKRFLQMAATSYDSATDRYAFNKTGTGLSDTQEKLLNSHDIPIIEVGRVDLTGSRDFKDGSISVTMHDVTFFAYSTGATPRIWASHKVDGNYTGSPQPGWEVYNLQSVNRENVSNLHAHFVLEKWDGAEGKWSANIDHGHAKVGGHSVSFDGGAAGTIDSGNAFSGTGAGVVKPK
jgi:hypothetical protein